MKFTLPGLAVLLACSRVHGLPAPANDLLAMSLEDLGKVRVTSVTGRPAELQNAAASIFVISAHDIRRSAATSLPEVLRLAPNLEVARLNAGQYAISARGFNNAIGNKLLVLVDGRIIYSPLFSGVFWDEQDLVLSDIERIEVISGPGATLWGSNAVNGVINIITKQSGETQGALAEATAGPEGSQVTARYGGRWSDSGTYRVYGMRLNRNSTLKADGSERPDASTKQQVGFRTDWTLGNANATVQGDTYSAGYTDVSNLAPRLSGGNLLARWRQEQNDGSGWQLQAVYDRSSREDRTLFYEMTRTIDLQFNQAFKLEGHDLIWGFGHRRATSDTQANGLVVFDPLRRGLAWSNLFVQDEWHPAPAWRVTLGAKVEKNVYTGAEFLPTLRVARDIGPQSDVWMSLSRAVRAPARLDRDFYFPGKAPFAIQGGANFRSEVANVAELGWRTTVGTWSASATAFYGDYGRLRGGRPGRSEIENRVSGNVHGIEAWGTTSVTPTWQLSAGLVQLRKSLQALPGSSPTTVNDLGNDPKQQWMLRSVSALGHGWHADLTVRHVSALPQPAVKAYTTADAKVSWSATPNLTLSLLVQNAFLANHVEFNALTAASEIPRAAYLQLRWETL